ncbi:MAG: hypothetical protein RLY70_2345 [Planctomycetota bacterium]
MADFVKVARVDSLAGDGKWMFEIGERLVVLFRVEGQFFCLDDVCTHDGGPLGEGRLEGHFIACPRHGAKFDVRNGHACTMPATEATIAHDVKVDGTFVWVRLRGGDEDSTEPDAASNPELAKASSVSLAGGDSSVKAGHECCEGHGGLHAAGGAIVDWNPGSTAGATGVPAGATVASSVASSGSSNGVCAAGTAAVSGAVAVVLCEDLVREELKRVIDPELFVNIVDLGLVYNVDLVPGEMGGSKVKIDMTMTSPMCPAGPQLIAQCKQFVGQMSGVDSVEVKIVMDPPWTPAKMSDSARDQLGIF